MSSVAPGDRQLHYCDSSHRWIAPPEIEQGAWEARLRTHLDQHRSTMGGPEDYEDMPERRPPRPARPVGVPRPRRSPENSPLRRTGAGIR